MSTAFSDHSTMLSCLSSLYPLEPEDLILNDLLQDKPSDNSQICRNCDECSEATSKCKDCDELLCDNCVRAHIRVKLTKDHFIVPLDDPQSSPQFNNQSSERTSSSSGGSMMNGNSFCEIHLSEIVRVYCDTCATSICSECTLLDHRGHTFVPLQDAFDGAKASTLKLLPDTKLCALYTKDYIDITQRAIESVSLKSHAVSREIRNILNKFLTALEQRERELLNKLEQIKINKLKMLQEHIERLKSLHSAYVRLTDLIPAVLDVGTTVDILKVKEHAVAQLVKFRSVREVMPRIDDELCFSPPDPNLLMAIYSMGDVFNHSPTNGAVGEVILRNIGGRSPPFNSMKTHDDMSIFSKGGMPVSIPNLIDTSITPMCDDDLKVLFSSNQCRPKMDMIPQRMIGVRPNCMPPLVGPGCSDRNSRTSGYGTYGQCRMIIGSEGEEDGQLCRPWGVCSDHEGNIIVADRSNNRIQIFRSDGTFLRKFGSQGSEPGNFDRPAGVAVDPFRRIIVADKDNHRIQIFTGDGQFVFKFGEKGSKIGQFNYPWDVATDSKGRVVVSDTRNHRVQLFKWDGTFLGKYGFENPVNMKHFDSPRGVCFGSKGCVIVTDFNNHRLVVIDPTLVSAKFLGSEGTEVKEFLRPQGVVVDAEGNIIVADSRNNRIQIFEQEGDFICQFGTAGKDPGQLDRPSGVCLTPDGRIVVVDFGNNRIQVF